MHTPYTPQYHQEQSAYLMTGESGQRTSRQVSHHTLLTNNRNTHTHHTLLSNRRNTHSTQKIESASNTHSNTTRHAPTPKKPRSAKAETNKERERERERGRERERERERDTH